MPPEPPEPTPLPPPAPADHPAPTGESGQLRLGAVVGTIAVLVLPWYVWSRGGAVGGRLFMAAYLMPLVVGTVALVLLTSARRRAFGMGLMMGAFVTSLVAMAAALVFWAANT